MRSSGVAFLQPFTFYRIRIVVYGVIVLLFSFRYLAFSTDIKWSF
jgi:hypothetical protein